jgi:hypothetical protein
MLLTSGIVCYIIIIAVDDGGGKHMGDFGIFGGLFWGIFLLAAGFIVLMKIMLNLQVSSGKLIFGLFILLIGVSLLTSNQGWGKMNFSNGNTNVFESGQENRVSGNNEYSTVFGSGTYDASGLQAGENVKINCAFGSCRVLLPKGHVYITVSSAFGSVHLPGGNNVSFCGSKNYGTDAADSVRIEIANAFGSVDVSGGD